VKHRRCQQRTSARSWRHWAFRVGQATATCTISAAILVGGSLAAVVSPAVAATGRSVQMPTAGQHMPPLAPVAHATRSGWSLQSTALPSVSQGNLFADACSSPTSCIAVGTFEDSSGTQVPLAEKWNGTTWSVQSAPSPAGATDSELDGISCISATSCLGVGFFAGGSGTQALAEEWNGTTWTIQPTPTPAGSGGSELESVSCSAPNDCTAVGTQDSPIGDVTLAESWDGTTWTIETTVNPRGARPPDYHSVLGSVSCTSATACTAAGWFTKTVKKDVTLAEVWNGTAWTVQATPDPAGAIVTKLTGVSCSSATACTAVGSSFNRAASSDVTLAERWNGTAWKLQSTPNPAGAVASTLGSVSCSSAVACTAVGSFEGSSDLFSLAEAWNGTAWALETTPNAATTTGSVLDGVSCSSSASCTAAGFYDSPAGALALAEAWNGHVWTIQATPSPPGPPAVSQLNGVSCSSATACTAVGFFQNSASTDLTLAERWNGTAWGIQPTPDPADADSFPGSALSAISCSSAAACMAVGSYTNTAGNVVTLAESWNGTAWKIKTTLNPADATNTTLAGVFCGSATDCTAVGRSFDAAGMETAVVESWNGAAWKNQAIAVPAGGTGAELSGVSCRSAAACTAVGSYNDSSGTQVTLAESWNGTAWHVQTTPDPAGATASALVGLSCSTAKACWAVGHSYDTSGTELTLAESLNGTGWKVQTTPDPSGAMASYIDGGVSCSGPKACSAVGSYTDSSGTQVTLAESWNGTAWTVKTTPNPAGAIESQLNGVSCASGGTCTAVGYSAPSLFNQKVLAEVKT
jgi:hypothetical protein